MLIPSNHAAVVLLFQANGNIQECHQQAFNQFSWVGFFYTVSEADFVVVVGFFLLSPPRK